MSSPIITVEHLGKQYRLNHQAERQRYTALRDVIAESAKKVFSFPRSKHSAPNGSGQARSENFWALKDVSFEIQPGEVVGIIGRNGAGKSTLLKILSQITEPTTGRVGIRGRVASLLEVGTGFHPELTGRENIYLNGAILGMKKAEIRRKFDEIVAFAEVEKFLDTPVKRYSSGMYVRLAFAVAAHLEPEILVVDEVLAVGDSAFQKKCLAKMGEVASKEKRTVVFVSHNMQTIRQLCPRTILLANGRKICDAFSGDVIQSYLLASVSGASLSDLSGVIAGTPPDPVFRLHNIDVTQDGYTTTELVSGKPLDITITYDVLQETPGFHVYFTLYDVDGTMLFDSIHNGDAPDIPTVCPGNYVSRATIPADFLSARSYDLEINAGIHHVRYCIPQPSRLRVTINVTGVGRVNRAYPGYATRGKIAPLIPWRTARVTASMPDERRINSASGCLMAAAKRGNVSSL